MDTCSYKDVSEIAKNVAEALAVLGAAGALYNWAVARRNRATDILLALDQLFSRPEVIAARKLLETHDGTSSFVESDMNALEPMLRFYVILRQVVLHGQISPSTARTSFCWWLAYAHSTAGIDRYNKVFADHLAKFYQSLSQWVLATDGIFSQSEPNPRPWWRPTFGQGRLAGG
jgi:hypothetical protein